MTFQHPHRQIHCHVEAFDSDGFGLAPVVLPSGSRASVSIPFTMPGDQVLAAVGKPKRGQVDGRLDAIIQPSPDRIAPKCVHFGVCGGCRWQHVPYAMQLAQKQSQIHALFAPFITAATQLHPILPSEPHWNYRNKMEFSFSSDRHGNRYLGLMQQQGRGHVFNLTECHLVNPWMADCVAAVRAWWGPFADRVDAYHPRSNRGTLRTLTVREGKRSGDRLVMLTVSGDPEFALPGDALQAWKQALIKACTPPEPGAQLSLFLCIHQAVKGHETQFYEMLLHGPDHIRERLSVEAVPGRGAKSLTFKVAPRAFFQPNPLQAERLYSRALQLLQVTSTDVVYDLYCGTGTLGIATSPFVSQVIGIERSPEAALDARTNAADNSCENVKILTGDVGEILRQRQEAGSAPLANVVLVDPPRAGLGDEAVARVLSLQPEQLLYISCNPKTQAVDMAQLCAAGYQLIALQPVDQFPHTIHTENIALLRRKVS